MSMRKIGFIGAESMHAVFFGRALASGAAGEAAVRLWAEDVPELAEVRVAQGGLSGVCGSLDELLDFSDTVMVLTRDGGTHRAFAEAVLARGKPVFVDKPFALSPDDARAIADCAVKHGTPLMGGSTLP